MEYRYLGSTGLEVSELCLGSMTFGREASEQDSHAMLDRFVAAGGNFIDTANVYSHGVSEEVVGRWLQGKPRDALVIATKVRFPMSAGRNDGGLSRKHILASVEASLRRLQTSYIDLYQVHCWDAGTPLEETLGTLHSLVERGLVRYIGASNVTGWQLQKAIDICRRHGWEAFSALQPQYNLLCRSTEWDLVPVMSTCRCSTRPARCRRRTRTTSSPTWRAIADARVGQGARRSYGHIPTMPRRRVEGARRHVVACNRNRVQEPWCPPPHPSGFA